MKFHKDALKIARQIKDRRLESNALGNMGSVSRASGKSDSVLDSFQQQLSLSVQIGYKRGEAHACWNISLILYESGDFSHVKNYAKRAIDIYDSLKNPLAEQIREQIAEWNLP